MDRKQEPQRPAWAEEAFARWDDPPVNPSLEKAQATDLWREKTSGQV